MRGIGQELRIAYGTGEIRYALPHQLIRPLRRITRTDLDAAARARPTGGVMGRPLTGRRPDCPGRVEQTGGGPVVRSGGSGDGSRRRNRRLMLVMAALTVVTGLVEAVSLLALGQVFTAMQTGNVLFLGFALAGSEGISTVAPSAAAPAAALASFLVGVVVGSRWESWAGSRGRHWFIAALLVEAGLLGAAGAAAWGLARPDGPPSARHLAVIALVAATMGMRNVTAIRAKVPDLPTTLVTRAMTTLVGGSAVGHDRALGYGSTGAATRRTLSVAGMFAGGLLGAWLLVRGWSAAAVLLLTAALLLTVALAHTLPARHEPPIPT